jgi:hypothetical protein
MGNDDDGIIRWPANIQWKAGRLIDAVENPTPPPVTKKVAWVCYSGEDVEPDPMDNLDEEFRSAAAVMKDPYCPAPARGALARYMERIQKLRSTSAKDST